MNTNTNINILSRREQDGEQLEPHEEYALLIAKTLSAIHNGTERSEDSENEPMSFYEYLSDPLDIEYRISAQHEYWSIKIAITLGGPACYIDTDLQAVVCYWSGSCICEYGWTLDERDEITAAIDDIFSELYELMEA